MTTARENQLPVEAVRHFNRFYTRQIGVLEEGLLQSEFSLTEARVLYELARREAPSASEVGKELGLDAGYLSRILRTLEERKLVRRQASAADARQSHLHLTKSGLRAFATLDARSSDEIAGMLRHLSVADQQRLLESMRTIEKLLQPGQGEPAPFTLRPPNPGDLGWVVQRHAAIYGEEYGWDARFEALVAGVVASYLSQNDPRTERCWIAEKDGVNVGSALLVRHTRTVAKLRLLLVEPKARGLGVGGALLAECIRFAEQAGYRKLTLWTNSVLHAARRMYERAGFQLVSEAPHRDFGDGLVGQTWELRLGKPSGKESGPA